MENTYTVKESAKGWMVLEGDQTETCAGYWDSKEEAEELAEILNEAC